MANTIKPAQKYVPVLDQIYKNASLTSVLDGEENLAKEGANAGELLVAKISMQGMANYNRSSGYKTGDVTLTWETIKADYDRGRMFTVDSVDNSDSADVAFGNLASEFIRTHVVPEVDAYRIAKYAQSADEKGQAKADLKDGEAVIKALRAAVNAMDEAEVPTENRVLFITPTVLGRVEDLSTSDSRAVLESFAQVVKVPQSRMHTQMTLADDANGGYKPTAGGFPINFMIIEKSAVVQHPKHVAPKIVTPELNQDADAYKFGYRLVNVAQVYENKKAGVYVHHATKADA